MHAVGVGDRAGGVRAEIFLNETVSNRARVGALATQGQGKRRIPPRNRMLAAHRVRDVRIIAQTVTLRQARPRFWNGRTAWPGDQAAQPVRHLLVDPTVNEIHLRLSKALH